MPAISKRFKAQPQDYGAEFLLMQTGPQQTLTPTGTLTLPMGNLSDAADTDKTKKHVGFIDELLATVAFGAAGSSTIVLNVKKRDVAAGATRTLVTGFDVKSLNAAFAGKRIPFDAAVTDKDKTMQAGDTLYAEVVAAGTVTTQPLLNLTALVALLK